MLNRLRKGEGSPEAIMRSEVGGKENTTLKPFYNKYQNVDENITAVLKY